MMALHRSRRAGLVAIAGLILAAGTTPVMAQEVQIGVQVEQIAGSDVYLTAGAEDGIQTEDTLFVRRAPDGDPVGTLRVISAARRRSVATFAGGAFPVTRGDSLYVTVLRDLSRVAEGERTPVARDAGRALPTSVSARSTGGPMMSGRISLDFSGYRSSTRGLGIDPETVDRDFATPSAAVRARVTRLPGDLAFNTNLLVRYRYSSDDIVEPPQAFRIYQASLEKTTRVMHLAAGRFYNPFVAFSSYWDGLLVRAGGSGLGGGIAAGFQPDQANEGVSTRFPKYGAFVNFATGRGPTRYQADLSVTTLRPRDSVPDHTYGAFGQLLQVGGVRLDQSIQVDRNPENGSLAVTFLRAGVSAPLSRRLTVYGAYFMRRPYVFGLVNNVIAERQDRGNLGVSVWMLTGVVSGDVAVSQMANGTTNYTYSGSFTFPRTGLLGLGISGATSYWTQGDEDRGLFISPALTRYFGSVNTRLMYQLYLTQSADTSIRSHAADLSATFPLARQLYATVRLRGQRGDQLDSTGIYTSIWMSF